MFTSSLPLNLPYQSAKGGPIAIHTALGWALQGAKGCDPSQTSVHQCLFLSAASTEDHLYRNVERLWQLDVLPFRSKKLVIRSREDQEAINLLENRTQRVDIRGVQHYATPLLRKSCAPKLKSPIRSIAANLRSTEKTEERP